VAEGIETLEQKDRLQELGCQIGQGYLLSKPLRFDNADKLIQTSKAEGILCP
jgi:EAL domain-containing protein (putative c-di-GMP-specific phosphodiesterase class I)